MYNGCWFVCLWLIVVIGGCSLLYNVSRGLWFVGCCLSLVVVVSVVVFAVC